MGLEIKSYDTLVRSSFERISKGIPYDEKLIPYKMGFIDECIEYFESREDFEKCMTLSNFKESRMHGKGWTKE
jgi:hypothetical protein